LQENRKSMIELQTSVKQDDTTRTRTPKPGYLNLSNIIARGWGYRPNLFAQEWGFSTVLLSLHGVGT
jgi:hypothetical protein